MEFLCSSEQCAAGGPDCFVLSPPHTWFAVVSMVSVMCCVMCVCVSVCGSFPKVHSSVLKYICYNVLSLYGSSVDFSDISGNFI